MHVVVIGSWRRQVKVQKASDLDQQILALERLQHVLVGVRLELLVLIEHRLRLLGGDEHQGNFPEAGATPQLVADGVADLLRLHGEHDDRRLVRASPLHRLVAARDVLDLEAIGREQPPELICGGGVRFDAQRNSVGHLASSETERSRSTRPPQIREGAVILSDSGPWEGPEPPAMSSAGRSPATLDAIDSGPTHRPGYARRDRFGTSRPPRDELRRAEPGYARRDRFGTHAQARLRSTRSIRDVSPPRDELRRAEPGYARRDRFGTHAQARLRSTRSIRDVSPPRDELRRAEPGRLPASG